MKIERRCKCGDACYQGHGEWYWVMETDGQPCVDLMPGELQYCPVCGYHLGEDGFAYEMVRADSVVEHWKQVEEALDAEMKAAGISHPQYKSMQELLENASRVNG